MSGFAFNAIVSSNTPSTYLFCTNDSAYIQKVWRISDRTTCTYGVRWDFPAPGVRSGLKPLAITDNNTLVPDQALYATRWYNFAPLFGVAYQIDNTPGKELIFRGGAGISYDIG